MSGSPATTGFSRECPNCRSPDPRKASLVTRGEGRALPWRPKSRLAHDPEKCAAVFPRDKREAFARRSCANKELKRDDDSSKSHRALARRQQIHLGIRDDQSVG